MNNVINETATLTTIPEKALNKLMQKMTYCICEDVYESHLAEEEVTQVDIGIGVLYIKYVAGETKWRFIPSANLNDAVTSVYKNGLNLMDSTLNSALAKKFTEAYKDLL